MLLEVGHVNAAEIRALVGEQLDANVGDLAAPLSAEPLQPGAPDGDLGEPDVGDAKALVHDELPKPRRRGEGGHLPVPGGDAVGHVDGLQPRARRHQRLPTPLARASRTRRTASSAAPPGAGSSAAAREASSSPAQAERSSAGGPPRAASRGPLPPESRAWLVPVPDRRRRAAAVRAPVRRRRAPPALVHRARGRHLPRCQEGGEVAGSDAGWADAPGGS
jgi:hypothetical protein